MTEASSEMTPLSYFIQTDSYKDTKTDGTSFDSNEYVLYLPFSSYEAFIGVYGTSPVIRMRSSVTDVTGKTLYDEYQLTFSYECWVD